MYFSVIIPVYNRPLELGELLKSLVYQEFKDFEVLIVEDGSDITCKNVVEGFAEQLSLRYFFIENVGQGFARNFGIDKAQGNYFVFFDSDCIIPENYLDILHLEILKRGLDAHGGPDAAAQDFSVFQKAINYSMTSLLTTGGIRGKMKDLGKFQARGFNMGFSAAVYHKIGGFVDPNRGEDIEISLRIKKAGFKLELIEDAFVFHKRKSSWIEFFKQSFDFGRNRFNVSRYHPDAVKLVHLIPTFFFLFCISILSGCILGFQAADLGLILLGCWILTIFFHSAVINSSIEVGFQSIFTSFSQLNFYGAGLLFEFFKGK